MFPRRLLEHYRSAVVHPEFGAELREIADDITALDGYSLGGRHYRRVPAGFPADHPNADLLLHRGLYAGTEGPIPEELYSDRLIDFCLERLSRMAGLHRWLVSFTGRFF
jgi:hypothetical protein